MLTTDTDLQFIYYQYISKSITHENKDKYEWDFRCILKNSSLRLNRHQVLELCDFFQFITVNDFFDIQESMGMKITLITPSGYEQEFCLKDYPTIADSRVYIDDDDRTAEVVYGNYKGYILEFCDTI